MIELRPEQRVTRQHTGHRVFTSAIEDLACDEGAVDHVFTDPPYADHVAQNVRRGKKTRDALCERKAFGFDSATSEKRARWAQWMANAARRWVGIFSDLESAMDWRVHCERAGLVYYKGALWVRTGDDVLTADRPSQSGAPQFTGDGPATGYEVIVLFHKPGRRRWNRRGKQATYTAPVVPPAHRVHPTQKPIKLMLDLLRDFCDPGETIADPFCGAGTTLLAAKLLGMNSVGGDVDPKFARYAQRRVDGGEVATP